MKLTRKSNKSMTLALKQLEIGPKKDKLDINVFKMKQEKLGCLTLNLLENLYKIIQTLLTKNKGKKENNLLGSFMLEFLQLNNLETLSDKSNYFSKLFQIQKLSQTLDLGLTSTDLVLPNWFTEFAEMKSHKLWLPLKIDSQELALNSLNFSAKNITAPSWFTVTEMGLTEKNLILNMNLKKISYPLSMSLSQVTMENAAPSSKNKEKKTETKDPPTGVLKVRLYPTKFQKKKLNLMMAANRFAWNLLAEKTSGTIFDLKLKKVVEKFRPLIQKRNISNKLAISVAPEECFDSAYRDFVKNRKTTIAQSKAKKDKTGKGFELPKSLKFRRKKDNKDSIEIRSRKFQYFHKTKTIRLYPKYFGKNKSEIKIKTNLKKLGVKINYSCRLNRENGKYFLIIPYIREVPKVESNRRCAIDPGGRTFLTGYNPEGSIFEIGKDTGFLRRKKQNIKKLQSKLDIEKDKRKRIKYRKIINNTYAKITNCVKDLHHKASKLLADTYKEILLPIFETSRITKKKNRRINNTAADNLLTLSHYKFRKLLAEKMENRGGKLIECTEEFTSKTCGNCGRLNHKLGSSKIFRCPYENCKVILDRDISAARNIYMKNYNLLSKN